MRLQSTFGDIVEGLEHVQQQQAIRLILIGNPGRVYPLYDGMAGMLCQTLSLKPHVGVQWDILAPHQVIQSPRKNNGPDFPDGV